MVIIQALKILKTTQQVESNKKVGNDFVWFLGLPTY